MFSWFLHGNPCSTKMFHLALAFSAFSRPTTCQEGHVNLIMMGWAQLMGRMGKMKWKWTVNGMWMECGMVPLLSQSGMSEFQESDMAEFQEFSSETQPIGSCYLSLMILMLRLTLWRLFAGLLLIILGSLAERSKVWTPSHITLVGGIKHSKHMPKIWTQLGNHIFPVPFWQKDVADFGVSPLGSWNRHWPWLLRGFAT